MISASFQSSFVQPLDFSLVTIFLMYSLVSFLLLIVQSWRTGLLVKPSMYGYGLLSQQGILQLAGWWY